MRLIVMVGTLLTGRFVVPPDGPTTTLAAVDRPEAHGALVAAHPPFPRSVQSELIERRTRLMWELGDDVLDLTQPAHRAAVIAAARGEAPTSCFHAALSCAELVRFPDLVLALTGIERLLSPDGELVLVEPVHHPGNVSTLMATLWALHPAVAGAHVERDVTDAVRRVGLTFTALERFTMSTSVWPLRLFIQARARRIAEVAA
jgi:hypothetical protein